MSEHPTETLHTVLEDTWDDGNAAGLDGWVGPGRGTEPVDDDAIFRRDRAMKNALVNLTGWRPPARVIETAEALDALKSWAIVLDSEGDVFRHRGDWWEFFGGYDEQSPTAHIALPATVLWQPEVDGNA